jgi:hypothetical protein
MRRVVLAALLSLGSGAAASHALADNPQIRTTEHDQSLARHAVVQLSDFTPGSGWNGGPMSPSDSASSKCAFDPKQSDLVQTGEAASSFKYKLPLLAIYSSATVYRTEDMALASWQRARPGLLGFLRCVVHTSLPSSAAGITVQPMSFPQLGSSGGAYRTTFDIAAGTTKVGLVIDVDFVVTGRTILSLIQFAPAIGADVVKSGEIRLARAMAGRANALAA